MPKVLWYQPLNAGIVVAVQVIPFVEYAAVVLYAAVTTKVLFPNELFDHPVPGNVLSVQVIPSVEEAAVVDPEVATKMLDPDTVACKFALVITGVVRVGLVSVSPATVDTVAPEAIDVEPSVGAEYEEIPVSPEPSPTNAVAVTVPPTSAPFLTLKFLSDI